MADLRATLDIANHGLIAQTERIKLISQNIANSDTTALSPEEEPYRRQRIYFQNVLDKELGVPVVKTRLIDEEPGELPLKYEPNHPAANEQGYIQLPNVTKELEKVDMEEAQRTYQANISVIEATRTMLRQTVELLR